MFAVNHLQVYSERMHDMQRAAAQRQIVRQAFAAADGAERCPSRLAAWLGRQFVQMGLRLQGQPPAVGRYAD